MTAPCTEYSALRVVRKVLPTGWVTTREMASRTGLSDKNVRDGLWAMVSLHEATVRSVGKTRRYYWRRTQ